jgi:arylsulfatase A-like enzyme
LRADRLGSYGNGRGLTPHLDRLAREGTRFTRAYAPMPCTLPAHVALFTGLSPRSSGVESNFVRLSLNVETLAERLRSAGFATAAFFNQFPFARANLLQGVESFEADPSELAERVVPAFKEWLARPRPRDRWFAWLHLYVPHGPLSLPTELVRRHVRHDYAGPLSDDLETMLRLGCGELPWSEEFAENYRDRYDAAVALADERVGEIRTELERAGQLDSTLVVCLADHGESLERGVLGLHAPVLRDVTLHVPLLMRGPSIPAARSVDALVQTMDLLPTLLARLGVAPPQSCDGRDLGRRLAAGEAFEGEAPAIAQLPESFAGRGSPRLAPAEAVVRRGPFKLVLSKAGQRELYDLVRDPDEACDVAERHPGVVRALAAAFAEWARSPGPRACGCDVDDAQRREISKLGY